MHLFAALLSILFCTASVQAYPVELDGSTRRLEVGPHLSYFEDKNNQLNVHQPQHFASLTWQVNRQRTFNQGYSDSVWWLTLDLHNASPITLQSYLQIRYPVLDYIDIYQVEGDWQAIHLLQSFGDKYPFSQRLISYHQFVLPLNLRAGEQRKLLIRIRSSSAIQFPASLVEPAYFYQQVDIESLLLGGWLGSLVVMVFYNLIIYCFVRQKVYLYYVAYVLAMLVFLASLKGLSFQYLWPQATGWNDKVIVVSLAAVVLFAACFTRRFLDVNREVPVTRTLVSLLYWLSATIGVCAIWLPYQWTILPVIVVAVMACILGGVTSFRRLLSGFIYAGYYIISWAMIFLGGIVLAMSKFGLLPSNPITENAVLLGSSLEVLMLSFAMGEKLNDERDKREQAEREALHLQKLANDKLEEMVEQRTSELRKANGLLARLSETDALTGINNRRYLESAMANEFSSGSQWLSMILVDIDHFKAFNDNYGHQVGDECLIAVARTIENVASRVNAHVGRMGGEEFAVLLPEWNAKDCFGLAEQIRQAVQDLAFRVEDKLVPITISAGGASLLVEGKDQSSLLIARADEALYMAKDNGRNRVELYVPKREKSQLGDKLVHINGH